MVDKALSGWGKAEHGRSLYCVECENWEQAEAIQKAAQDRPEMKRVTISDKPRRARAGDHLKIVTFASLGAGWKGYHLPTQWRKRLERDEPATAAAIDSIVAFVQS
jgi:hypothetical protein